MRKKQMNVSDHMEVSIAIQEILENLGRILLKLSNHFPKTNKMFRFEDNAETYVQKIRCELDNIFFGSNPTEEKSPYYKHKCRRIGVK